MSRESVDGAGLGAESPGFLAGAKGMAAGGLALLRNRLELLGVELAEERVRLLALLAYGAAAFVALSAGIVFLAIFITVLLWDSHRLLALGMFAALFIGAGVVALNTAVAYARRPSSLFAASLAELRKDEAAVKTEQ